MARSPKRPAKKARRKTRPTNGSRRLSSFAERLAEQREEILDLYRHDVGVGVGVGINHDGEDDIDRANFDTDRDLALALSTGERKVLEQIEAALGRIDEGAFGSCTSCTEPIGEERLVAIPWARYCIDCQELEEKGLLD
ncbi:MAG: TraR/DksA family transcriptional regulator [Acidobacteriota bacterium]|nr:TraR/DksA family transcriptional regulator [Acidobacteriota bacterium]